MKTKNSGLNIVIILLSAIFISACSCSTNNQSKQASVSFTQDKITLTVDQSIDLLDFVNYENLTNEVSFSIDDNDYVVSLEGSHLTALNIGECAVHVIYEDLKDDLSVSVISDKPHISYTKNNYEFDINDGAFSIKDFVSVSPVSSSLEISSSRGDYSFNNGSITFNDVGNYIFTLKAKYNDAYSFDYVFSVFVYDYLKLSGRGTIANPYTISSSTDLKRLSDEVLAYKDLKDKYFLQTCDIDISEFSNWTPIGTFGIPFEGIYNGNGKEITGLTIHSNESWQGLFGFSSGTIENLTVRGEVSVSCRPDFVYSHSFCAGICGGLYNNALINNCVNYVNVHGDSYVGGICGGIARSDEMIVGRDQSQIVNCKNYGTISGDDTYAINENAMYFGGIVGESLGILTGNENHGKVIVSGSKTRYVGGVCGLAYTIFKYGMYLDEDLEKYANNDNFNYGEVIGYHSIGGVFGANVLPSHNCVNYGEVRGDICVGGVSGLNGTSSIIENNNSVSLLDKCKNYGKVFANLRYAGGITSCSYFDVTNCENYGDVTGGISVYYVGGVVGNQTYGNVTSCMSKESANISGYHSVGGIVGFSNTNSISITKCNNYSNVLSLKDSDDESVHIGGIVGLLGTNNTVNECENHGNIIGNGTRNSPSRWGGIGGIAGSIYNSSKIFDSSNYGSVYAKQQVGGIFGYSNGNSLTSVWNSNNYGDISSTHNDPHLGGIAGRINGTTLFNCQNDGNLITEDGATHVGDLYGSAASSSTDGNKVSGDGYSPYFYLFSGGKGFEDDPFLIATTKDFELLRERISSEDENSSQQNIYYKLINDIVVTGGLLYTKEFSGVFDGNNHSITLNINNANSDDISLFALNNGTIMNLTVKGQISARNRVASIALTNNGTIRNCINKIDVTANSRVGGITSNNKGLIDGCINEGSISGSSQYIGGISGVNGSDSEGGTIINSYNYGDIQSTSSSSQHTSNGNCVGGIVGFSYANNEIRVMNCFNFGDVSGVSALGGVIGNIKTGTSSSFTYLYNFGNISGHEGSEGATYSGHIGGVIGMLGSNVDIADCYNCGDVNGNGGQESGYWRGVGGIVGSFYASTISRCFSLGNLNVSLNGGGIAGYSQGSGSKNIINCVSGMIFNNRTNNGGILGRGNNTTISNSISFAKGNESKIIYGYGTNVTSSNNSTFTETNSVATLLRYLIYGYSIKNSQDAEETLNHINYVLTQLSENDYSVLSCEYTSGKMLNAYMDASILYIESIINGGNL